MKNIRKSAFCGGNIKVMVANDNLKCLFIGKNYIYCYGIGFWANIVADFCAKNRIKLKGFIISSRCNDERRFFRGLPVFVFNADLLGEKDGVIIGTRVERNILDISNMILSHSKCKNIYLPFNKKMFKEFCIKISKKNKRFFTRKRRKKSIFHYDVLRKDIKTYWCEDNEMQAHCLSANYAYGQYKIIKRFIQRNTISYKC